MKQSVVKVVMSIVGIAIVVGAKVFSLPTSVAVTVTEEETTVAGLNCGEISCTLV